MIINNEFREVLNSRMYENRAGKIFDNPITILEPCIKLIESYVDNDDYRVKYSVGSINRNEDKTANIAYDKLIVEFKLNTNFGAEDYSNTCIAYDLSNKEPVYKVAVGRTIRTCLNMCIWTDGNLFVTNDYTKLKDKLQLYVNDLNEKEKQFEIFRDSLENRIITLNQTKQLIGKIVYEGKNTNIRAAAVNASDELQNSKSNYYTADNDTTVWNVYNAITQQFSNKFAKGYTDVLSNTLELTKLVQNYVLN